MHTRSFHGIAAAVILAASSLLFTGCKTSTQPTAVVDSRLEAGALDKIRDEGMNRSQIADTLSNICDVIGPRLTASPGALRANEWTRDQLTKWGLENAHLEEWGPFGRGWEVERFSMQLIEPYTVMLNGYPKAWSPGFDGPVEAPIVYVDATKEEELEQYKGKLKGAIVLVSKPREISARFEPLATRLSDDDLKKLADAKIGASALLGQPSTQNPAERRAALAENFPNLFRRGGTTQPATQPTTRPGRGRFDPFASRVLQFADREGALLVVTQSTRGDGGTFFVQGASVPGEDIPQRNRRRGTTDRADSTTQPADAAPASRPTTRPRVWAKDAPKIPAQMMLAAEDYNRLVRMIKLGKKDMKALVDLRVKFYDDAKAYNTIAEIPGTDLKDEIVMVGGHLDSWHGATGATDNAAGAAAAMEAVRIIKASGLKPRRTIRVALWTGEEQGLYGSAAYVKKHLGSDPEAESRRNADRERMRRNAEAEQSQTPDAARREEPATTEPAVKKLVKGPEYDKFSVYFNLDNGTGKIRGIYAQNNLTAAAIFKPWITPFADVGAKTVTLSNTGSTDHVSFDAIGLPGFQFIQDQIEYSSRTHHSSQDVYDRLQIDDLKQAATIMATFVYRASMIDERMPRKDTKFEIVTP